MFQGRCWALHVNCRKAAVSAFKHCVLVVVARVSQRCLLYVSPSACKLCLRRCSGFLLAVILGPRGSLWLAYLPVADFGMHSAGYVHFVGIWVDVGQCDSSYIAYYTAASFWMYLCVPLNVPHVCIPFFLLSCLCNKVKSHDS